MNGVVLERKEGTTIDNNRASVNTRQGRDKASIMPLQWLMMLMMLTITIGDVDEKEEEMDNSNT